MSKDIPIIFTGPMVRAQLAGRKTMTRRILKASMPPAPAMDAIYPGNAARHAAPYFDSYRSECRGPENPEGMSRNWCWWTRDDRQCLPTVNVRFAPGDRLWVRENFAHVGTSDPGFLTYQATYPEDLAPLGMENVPATLKEAGYRWMPSIHMPRMLSRLTLIVSGVKVERLQEISEDDAWAEGVCHFAESTDRSGSWDGLSEDDRREMVRVIFGSAVNAFHCLFDQLHGPEVWTADPFVVAVTFRVIKANIDAPEARVAA